LLGTEPWDWSKDIIQALESNHDVVDDEQHEPELIDPPPMDALN
jgi:hypothetical protein